MSSAFAVGDEAQPPDTQTFTAQPAGEGTVADVVMSGVTEVPPPHRTDAYKWYFSYYLTQFFSHLHVEGFFVISCCGILSNSILLAVSSCNIHG